jgi:hypothetical protein
MEGLSPDERPDNAGSGAAPSEPEGLGATDSACEVLLTELWEPLELRVLLNLSYSLHMVRRLPSYASDDAMRSLPAVVRQASRDALFTHTRMLAEFFWKLPESSANARMFLPSWTPPAPLAVRLENRWRQAASFVAPMRKDRTPEAVIEPRQIDLGVLSLSQIAGDFDATAFAYVSACEAADIELLPEVRTLLDGIAA